MIYETSWLKNEPLSSESTDNFITSQKENHSKSDQKLK
jgi:hypothetical protein